MPGLLAQAAPAQRAASASNFETLFSDRMDWFPSPNLDVRIWKVGTTESRRAKVVCNGRFSTSALCNVANNAPRLQQGEKRYREYMPNERKGNDGGLERKS